MQHLHLKLTSNLTSALTPSHVNPNFNYYIPNYTLKDCIISYSSIGTAPARYFHILFSTLNMVKKTKMLSRYIFYVRCNDTYTKFHTVKSNLICFLICSSH